MILKSDVLASWTVRSSLRCRCRRTRVRGEKGGSVTKVAWGVLGGSLKTVGKSTERYSKRS